jgi:hypothetical protein
VTRQKLAVRSFKLTIKLVLRTVTVSLLRHSRAAVQPPRSSAHLAMPFTLPPLLLAATRNPAVAVGLPIVLGIGSGLVTRTSVQSWYPTVRKARFRRRLG